MKNIVATILVILFLSTLVAAAAYGAVSGYEILSSQWDQLNPDRKANLIIISTVLIFCTVFLSSSIRTLFKKAGPKSTGKVIAYNNFLKWYSALKNDDPDAPKASTFKEVKNQIMLWGNDQVVKQTNLLYKNLNGDGKLNDEIMEKADHVFLEIRRELGYRRFRVDRSIT